MMLWHKAWVESRARLVPLDTYNGYVYRIAYQGFARTLFLMFCFMLGLGGLLRERELGTAGFTLALPVSRLRLVVTRAAVGWLELVVLGCLPSLIVVSLSPIVGRTYPLSQALQFSVLWIAGGSAMFAVAFLASCVLAGEYTAFIAAWVVFFAHTMTTQYARLIYPALNGHLFTIQEIMSGFRMPYLDPQTHQLIGPFPIAIVAMLAAITCALTGSAAVFAMQSDF